MVAEWVARSRWPSASRLQRRRWKPVREIVWLGEPAAERVIVGGKVAPLSRVEPLPRPTRFLPDHQRACERRAATASDNPGPEPARYVAAGSRRGLPAAASRPGDQPAVAVRSSAVDEDGAEASFAGQHETYLNVVGADAVGGRSRVLGVGAGAHARWSTAAGTACRWTARGWPCWSSSSSPPTSRRSSSAPTRSAAAATRSSSTPAGGWARASSAARSPRHYVVRDRAAGLDDRRRGLAEKRRMTVAVAGGTREVDMPRFLRSRPALADEQVARAARLALALEAAMGWPVDLECACRDERLYLLQCRPITTLGRRAHQPKRQPRERGSAYGRSGRPGTPRSRRTNDLSDQGGARDQVERIEAPAPGARQAPAAAQSRHHRLPGRLGAAGGRAAVLGARPDPLPGADHAARLRVHRTSTGRLQPRRRDYGAADPRRTRRRINTYLYSSMAPNIPPEQMEAQGRIAEERISAGRRPAWRALGAGVAAGDPTAPRRLGPSTSPARPAAARGPPRRDRRADRSGSGRSTSCSAFPMLLGMSLFDDFYRDLFGDEDALPGVPAAPGLPEQDRWSRPGALGAQPPGARHAGRAPRPRDAAGGERAGARGDAGRAGVPGGARGFLARTAGAATPGPSAAGLDRGPDAGHQEPEGLRRPAGPRPGGRARRAGERSASAWWPRPARGCRATPGRSSEQFEALLQAAQAANVLSEDHNFWIDFSCTTRCAWSSWSSAGGWPPPGCSTRADDVLLPHPRRDRDDGRALPPLDRRALVAERRAEIERASARSRRPPCSGTPPRGPPPSDPIGRGDLKMFGGGPPPPRTSRACCAATPARPARPRAGAGRPLARRGRPAPPGRRPGDRATAPPWTPLFATAAAVVTDAGGILSHCAVVAREYGIPAVVGTARRRRRSATASGSRWTATRAWCACSKIDRAPQSLLPWGPFIPTAPTPSPVRGGGGEWPSPQPLPSPSTGPLRGANHAYHGAPPCGLPRGIGCADVIRCAGSPCQRERAKGAVTSGEGRAGPWPFEETRLPAGW